MEGLLLKHSGSPEENQDMKNKQDKEKTGCGNKPGNEKQNKKDQHHTNYTKTTSTIKQIYC